MKKNSGILGKKITLQIISIIAAFITWFYILAVVDPPIEMTIDDIHVSFSDIARLEANNMRIVSDHDINLQITATGQRRVVNNLTPQNIIAFIDLSPVTEPREYDLPISVTLPFSEITVKGRNPSTVRVVVDVVVNSPRNLTGVAVGSFKDGFTEGEFEFNPSSVMLKGALTHINEVKNAVVYVDVTNKDADFVEEGVVRLLDEEGMDITDKYDIEFEPKLVEVNYTAMRQYKVPVHLNHNDINAQNDYEITPQSVTVKSRPNRRIEYVTTEPLNIMRAVTTETTQTVNLNLPDGISTENKTVTVKIKPK